MAQDDRVKNGTKVIGIGNEGVANPFAKKTIEPPTAGKRGVQIAMTGRTPFELRISGPKNGGERVGIDLGNPVLHQLDFRGIRQPVSAVFREIRQGILARAKAVHQQEPHRGSAFAPELHCLADDEIEEVQAAGHGQQAFRTLKSHSGAKSAVELDHDGLSKQGGIGSFLRKGFQGRDLLRRRDVGLGDQACLIPEKGLVVPAESRDDRITHSGGAHLVLEKGEIGHGGGESERNAVDRGLGHAEKQGESRCREGWARIAKKIPFLSNHHP